MPTPYCLSITKRVSTQQFSQDDQLMLFFEARCVMEHKSSHVESLMMENFHTQVCHKYEFLSSYLASTAGQFVRDSRALLYDYVSPCTSHAYS